MKCSKCNKEIGSYYFIKDNDINPPTFSIKNWNLIYCNDKCRNEWENSECGKNYDLQRLKAIDEWLKKCKDGYKWSGGGLEEGWWEKRPSDEVYEYDKDEEFLIKEAKKIRQKWNIKEEQPQERERERETNFPTSKWNSAIRTNC